MTTPTSPAAAPSAAPALFASITREELTVGGLVRTTFAVWWRNALRFAGLSLLLVFVPVLAMGMVLGIVIPLAARRAVLPSSVDWGLVAPIVMVVVIGLFMVVQTGGLTYGAVQHLAQRRVRFGAMVGAGFRRAVPLIGTGLLMYLAILAGFVLLIIPGIIVGCALSVALPAVVVERIGPIQALQRSWVLTRDHRVTVFAAGLVLGLALFGANVVLQVAGRLLGPVAALVLMPVQLFNMSLPVLLPAVAYHDLRVEKEGTDTSELARVFE